MSLMEAAEDIPHAVCFVWFDLGTASACLVACAEPRAQLLASGLQQLKLSLGVGGVNAAVAVNALRLVEGPHAWLPDPLAKTAVSAAGDDDSSDDSVAAVLTLEGLQREHAMACAGVALDLTGPDACKRRSTAQLLMQLLAAGVRPACMHNSA